MNADLIRFIDSISRDKAIDKGSVFVDLETAIVSAIRKAHGEIEDVECTIDRVTGDISASVNGEPVDMKTLGRIAAQTGKQVMIQKIREDERDSIFEEYSKRVGTVVTGTVSRYDGGGIVVNLGRAEAFMPRSEQIPGGSHQAGERIRGMILDVREDLSQVRIVLTQTHPDYIRKLFELEVPEVNERIIEIRALAREAGYRTKLAVTSIDAKVDPVGACVGVRGSRIRNIVDELGGEKIDIVRWNESSQVLITNALKPAEVKETFLCFELGRATVIVDEEQLSLAIGKRGQNVRLGARLTGWDIDIMTPADYDKHVSAMDKALKTVEGVEDVLLDKLLAIGIVRLDDLVEVGAEPVTKELELDETLAKTIVEVAEKQVKILAEEAEAAKQAAAEAGEAENEAGDQDEGTPNGEASGTDQVVAGDEPVAEATESGGEETASSDSHVDTGTGEDVDAGIPLDEASVSEVSIETGAKDVVVDGGPVEVDEAS